MKASTQASIVACHSSVSCSGDGSAAAAYSVPTVARAAPTPGTAANSAGAAHAAAHTVSSPATTASAKVANRYKASNAHHTAPVGGRSPPSMCAVMLGPTVGAWPRTRTLAVQHREPSGPSPPPLRSPLRPSLFRRARTLSVEAPVHGPEVLCLYVILALLEIYNHFRQSHARQLMSVYRYTGD